MTKLAVIAFNRSEHQRLLDVWKFFPFTEDIQYHYIYSGADSSSELPQHPGIQAINFSGNTLSEIKAIESYISEQEINQLCFASIKTFNNWIQALELPYATLYSGKNLSIADVTSLSTDVNDLEVFLNMINRHPALLNSEKQSFASTLQASVYENYQQFLETKSEEVLLTRNTDLVSAVCGCNTSHFRIYHYLQGQFAANLCISEKKFDFLQTQNRLQQAADLALRSAKQDEKNQNAAALSDLPSPLRSYSFFAEYYDTYMSHVNYEDWLSLMLTWYRRYSQQPMKRVLELACGTANASEILVFRGYEVDACDNSSFMLHSADDKSFKPNLFLSSLTDPIPAKDYDFIFCLFDSINYLTQKSDVKTLLKNVHTALRPGGIFIFDISTLLNSLENFNETINYSHVKDGYLVHSSNYEVLSNKQITHFTLFRRNGFNYDKFEERHVQRVYRSPELAELIATSELKLQAIFAPEMRTNLLQKLGSDIDNRYFRLFFLLQKPE